MLNCDQLTQTIQAELDTRIPGCHVTCPFWQITREAKGVALTRGGTTSTTQYYETPVTIKLPDDRQLRSDIYLTAPILFDDKPWLSDELVLPMIEGLVTHVQRVVQRHPPESSHV